MKTVTIELLDVTRYREVIEWCFVHLSRPAYLYSWTRLMRSNRRDRVMVRPMIWRKWTKKLDETAFGTVHMAYNGPSYMYSTFGFRSNTDATLFALKWGSQPLKKNAILYKMMPEDV